MREVLQVKLVHEAAVVQVGLGFFVTEAKAQDTLIQLAALYPDAKLNVIHIHRLSMSVLPTQII